MKPFVELDRWPLILTRWPASVSERDLDEYVDGALAWLEREECIAHVVDLRMAGVGSLSPTMRSHAARRLADLTKLAEKWVIAEGVVAASTFTRGAVTAFTWMMPPTWPRRVFDRQAEAERWAEAQLATCVRPSGRTRTSAPTSLSARTR